MPVHTPIMRFAGQLAPAAMRFPGKENRVMKEPVIISRRTMLAAGAAALGAPAILAGAAPTKDPVRVGHIGAGTRQWT